MTQPQTPEDPHARGQLDREAAAWFARMRGPDAEESRPAFERWLALGALHRAAYNRAGELWSMGRFLSEERKGQGVPLSAAQETSGHAGRARPAAMATVMLLALLVAGWALLPLDRLIGPEPQEARRDAALARDEALFETVAGETRTITLADGSIVTLRPVGRLRVLFDGVSRRLDLERGAARFHVAHEGRAFIVKAGEGIVTAHGTVFDVALAEQGKVVVKLLEGSVSVALPGRDRAAAAPPVTRWLVPGEAVEFVAPAARPQAAAWDGATEFEEARLADVVALANRTPGVGLRLDPALAELRVSGRFRTNDPQALAGNIAATLGLQVHQLESGEILISRE